MWNRNDGINRIRISDIDTQELYLFSLDFHSVMKLLLICDALKFNSHVIVFINCADSTTLLANIDDQRKAIFVAFYKVDQISDCYAVLNRAKVTFSQTHCVNEHDIPILIGFGVKGASNSTSRCFNIRVAS